MAESDCLLCQLSVKAKPGLAPILCDHCHLRLPVIRSACPVCALPLAAGNRLACGDCLKNTPPFTRTTVAFHYEPPISDFIGQLKFNGRRQLLPLLSDYLLTRIKVDYANDNLPQQLIAVPLHKTKMRQRGFNQAQLLCRRLAKSLSISQYREIATRQRNTVTQVSLDAVARQRNLKGAFRINGTVASHVAIIDDVMTTGTTVTELARELVAAGAQRIDIWCVARAFHIA